MKTKLIAIAAVFLVAANAAIAQPPEAPRHPMQMGHGQTLPKELKLTDQQKADIQKIRLDQMQKRIDINAQIQHARLDYEKLASADNPDRDALAAKLDDIAKLRGELHKNLLDGWFAVNKILTPNQQKIWKKVLQHPGRFAEKMRMHRNWRNRMMGGEFMMNRMGTMRQNGMMGRNEPTEKRIEIMKHNRRISSDSTHSTN